MKVVMANAISLNGMIAREDGQEDWLPSEGWVDFLEDVKRTKNFIMGRETYELVQRLYPDYNFDSIECKTKIIVTSQDDFVAEGYVVVQSPEQALEIAKSRDASVALLVGGGKLNASFIEKNMVNEIWVTIVPHILGKGRSVISESAIDKRLSLIEYEMLSGNRIKLKYEVL